MNTITLSVNKQVPNTYYVPGAGDTKSNRTWSSTPRLLIQLAQSQCTNKQWMKGHWSNLRENVVVKELPGNGKAGKALSGLLEAILGCLDGT